MRWLGFYRLEKRCPSRFNWLIFTVCWVGISIVLFVLPLRHPFVSAIMTSLGLCWFVTLFATRFVNRPQWRFFGFIDRYTKAIWLMHPMFMKAYFFILALVGVEVLGSGNALYIICYLAVFLVIYLLPIGVLWVLNHVWKLGFVINPQNYFPPPKIDKRDQNPVAEDQNFAAPTEKLNHTGDKDSE